MVGFHQQRLPKLKVSSRRSMGFGPRSEADAEVGEAADLEEMQEEEPVAVEPVGPRAARRRRANAVPQPFRGFMAQRRGVAEVQLPELPEEPLREILQVPNRRPQGRMRQPDEWKGYAIPGGGMVTVPLDGPVALEEFEQLDPKTKYMLLQRAQEAWFGESRLKAVEAKDDMGAFVNVQLEMFLCRAQYIFGPGENAPATKIPFGATTSLLLQAVRRRQKGSRRHFRISVLGG
eukprot:symbB.v1.2.006008.t1/scaffold356.1/size220710/5